MTVGFCIRCGARLRLVTERGRRRRRCPRCGWIFYGNPVPAAVGLVERRGRVLLTLRARPPYAGTWDLPGGFLESGESAEAGLARELMEELGMRVVSARLVATVPDQYGPGGFPVLSLVYRVRPTPGPLLAADDVAEARWFPRTRLPFDAIAFPSIRRLLRRWSRRKRG